MPPPYPEWRAAFVAECRQWLSSNGLNTKPAEYLANFIETGLERWSYARVQATITSEDVLAKKSKRVRAFNDESKKKENEHGQR